MSKNTPGPWHVEDEFVFAESGLRIADTACEDQDGTVEEMQANALLIAASPELYVACEVGFTALWAIKARLAAPRTDAEKVAMDELQRRMDILGAALRKARGEA